MAKNLYSLRYCISHLIGEYVCNMFIVLWTHFNAQGLSIQELQLESQNMFAGNLRNTVCQIQKNSEIACFE